MKIKIMALYTDGREITVGQVDKELADALPIGQTFQFKAFGPRFQMNTGLVLQEDCNKPHKHFIKCWYEF